MKLLRIPDDITHQNKRRGDLWCGCEKCGWTGRRFAALYIDCEDTRSEMDFPKRWCPKCGEGTQVYFVELNEAQRVLLNDTHPPNKKFD